MILSRVFSLLTEPGQDTFCPGYFSYQTKLIYFLFWNLNIKLYLQTFREKKSLWNKETDDLLSSLLRCASFTPCIFMMWLRPSEAVL